MRYKIFIITLLIVLLGINDSAYSVEVYSIDTVNDGSIIRKCLFEDGQIEYCTADDAVRALNVRNNHGKYSIVEHKVLIKQSGANFEKNYVKVRNAVSFGVNALGDVTNNIRIINGYLRYY